MIKYCAGSLGLSFVAATVAGFVLAGDAAGAGEQLPPGAKLIGVDAWPKAITLKYPYDYTQLLLTGRLETGERVDVTRMAQVEPPAGLLSISPTGLVRPKVDGKGELKCSLLGQTVLVPVAVSGQQQAYPVSYVRDVMPVMSKLGCNSGTCHGAQSGKNGFKLSLRGYDPLYDHRALTDDIAARRFNRAAPEQSLMLLKPTGLVPHVGGVLMNPGEPYYELLKAWIAAGVKLDLDSPRATAIDIFPKSTVIPLIGMRQQMAVLAKYSDGSVRDVTAEAFIESSNTDVAKVDKQGLVSAERRGEATVLARYEGAYTAAGVVIMGDRSGFTWQDVPVNNYLDTLVYDKLKQVKIQPSGLCGDADFIRRIYLDLQGLPPQPQEVRAFLADPRPTRVKRDELIDRLIGSPEFVDHWTNKWADLLQVNRKFLGEQGAAALRSWIRAAVADNMPYDKFAHTILTASGSNAQNPPASYYKILREPGATMENTTQLFLAVRFNCNKCHDHPFERWTQDQYYQLAAYFARVKLDPDPKFANQKIGGTNVEKPLPLVEVVSDQPSGEVKHDRTGALTPPKFPFLHADLAPPSATRREQLAHWITSRENPYFARSYVNRLWSYLLGAGIIEPVDDIRAGNPPTNPQLLDALTKDFVDHGFDVRHVLRVICQSRVYQHSIATNPWNQDDEINYSHALARRLPAEVLYDAIYRATGAVSRLPGLPPGAHAAQLLDSNVELPSSFLSLFGKPPRESACECERSSSMMLGPVLNLVNGPIIGEALRDPDNRIAKLVAEEKDDQKVVEELFLAILCRSPREAELASGLKALRGSEEEYRQLSVAYDEAVAARTAYEKQLAAKQAEWERGVQTATPWTVLEPTKATASKGTTLTGQPDGSLLAGGKNNTPETYTVVARTKLTGISAIRLEVLPDPSLPQGGPGRAVNGNFVLNEFRVSVAPQGDKGKGTPIQLHRAVADYSQPQYGIAGAIDGNPATGWAIGGAEGKAHTAVLETKELAGFAEGTTLTFTLEHRYAAKLHNIGRFRLSVTTAKPPLSFAGLPEKVVKILGIAPDKRTAEQQAELSRYYRSVDGEWARLNQLVNDHPRPPADQRQLGAQDLAWALLNSPAFLFNH